MYFWYAFFFWPLLMLEFSSYIHYLIYSDGDKSWPIFLGKSQSKSVTISYVYFTEGALGREKWSILKVTTLQPSSFDALNTLENDIFMNSTTEVDGDSVSLLGSKVCVFFVFLMEQFVLQPSLLFREPALEKRMKTHASWQSRPNLRSNVMVLTASFRYRISISHFYILPE